MSSKVQLHHQYEAQGLEVITVNLEGEEIMPEALAALKKHSVTTTNWCVAEAMNDEVMTALDIEAIPALIIYDMKGTARKTIIGEVEQAELEAIVQELLQEA